MKREPRHVPVLLQPVLGALKPKPGQIIVDCTLGLGGHSAALLQRISPGGLLIGIDFDPPNIEIARSNLQTVGGSFRLFHNNFPALPTVLAEASIDRVD